MWRPPERIKHSLPVAHWPTAKEAQESLLFSTIDIGNVTAQQRTWVPAMVPWRANEAGEVTTKVIDWYKRFAEGQPGVLVVEATGIRDIPSGPLLRIGHDRFVDGLKRLTDAIHEASHGKTLVFIQLIDFLAVKRRPTREKFFGRFLEINDAHRRRMASVFQDEGWGDASHEKVREQLLASNEEQLRQILSRRELDDLTYGYRERVWDTDLPHIQELPQKLPGLFADAAERAFRAGFDGVELHYAHAYTMASFLSARNMREDEYGGTRENRVRLPVEVLQAVRERVGKRVLGLRFLGEDAIAGGSQIEDAVFFAEAFCRAGTDFLSVSKGGKFEDAKQPKVGAAVYPYTGKSGYECMPSRISDKRGPFGRNLEFAREIRQKVRSLGYEVPVITAGGFCEFSQAEEALSKQYADVIASARQTLADPDWFLKMKQGVGREIRRCDYTNYCEALDQKHLEVTCKLWDRQELDEENVAMAADGKRRLLAPPWKPQS